MTVYHAGCEPNVMSMSYNPVTTAGKFDSSYSRCAMRLDGTAGFGSFEVPSIVGDNSATGWWLHFMWVAPNDNPNDFTTTERGRWDRSLVTVYDAVSGNIAASIVAIDNTYGEMAVRLYSYDSATYTQSTTWQFSQGAWDTFDMHCYVDGADSKLDVYLDGVIHRTLTRTTDDNNGLKYVLFNSPYNTTSSGVKDSFLSEIIVADTDTRGWRVKTLPPTGDSATNTAWTGSYTDVDEIVPDDSGAYTTSVGQLETYTMGTIGAGQGLVAVAVGTLIAGNGTNDCQQVLRKGGTDYVSADLGLTTGKLPYCSVWNTDPTDSQPWDAGETLSGVEFGVKSVA